MSRATGAAMLQAKPSRPQVSPRAPGLKPGCNLCIESGTLPAGVIKQGFGLSLK